MAERIQRVGTWVKFLRYNGGDTARLRNNVGGEVTRVTEGEVTIDIYSPTGVVLYAGYYVYNDGTYVEEAPRPEFKPLLAGIPDTEEVQRLKDAVWTHITKVGKEQGYESVARQMLAELGISKPNGGDVEATVSFTIKVPVESLDSDADITTFAERVGRIAKAQQLLTLAKKAKAPDVSIVYNLVPHRPIAPTVAPAPESPRVSESVKPTA